MQLSMQLVAFNLSHATGFKQSIVLVGEQPSFLMALGLCCMVWPRVYLPEMQLAGNENIFLLLLTKRENRNSVCSLSGK